MAKRVTLEVSNCGRREALETTPGPWSNKVAAENPNRAVMHKIDRGYRTRNRIRKNQRVSVWFCAGASFDVPDFMCMTSRA